MMNIKDIVKPLGAHSFLAGVGVAALTYFLAPQLKQSLRPAAVKGTQGVMALGIKTKQLFEDSRERFSNIVSETVDTTQEKIKDVAKEAGISSILLKELREERDTSNQVMKELRDSILSLKEEISHMKRGENLEEG